jgi:orotate phosphoribosyltransferase-like protein
MSDTRSDRRRMKELKVLELHDKGFSSRKIASLVHLSLRDVTNYINRLSNKTKSPSSNSVMDEVVLEYRLNLLRSEVRDLGIEKDNLMNEVKDLRAQKFDLLCKLLGVGCRAKGFGI